MSKFPKGICATQGKTSRKEGKKTGLKMRQPKGGWNDNLSLAYQKYILNQLALLPEPKLEKVKNTSEIAKHGQTQGESLGQTPHQ